MTARVRPATGVFATEVDGELVLLQPGSGRYYGLDRVGLAVWQEIARDPSADRVVDVLLERFDVDRATLSADVERLIAELEEAELVDVDRG